MHPDIELYAKIIGIFGVILALLLNWRAHAERSTFDMIDKMYSLCHTLESHLLKEWYLSHLFCIDDDEYYKTKTIIAKKVKEEQIEELQIKERLFAIHVFIVFEQVLYQKKHSSFWLNRKRNLFLKEMLSYFTDRLLQNPRLLGFLELNSNNNALHLEKTSIDFLKLRANHFKKTNIDYIGPFGSNLEQKEPL
jgi:hypothetical protein